MARPRPSTRGSSDWHRIPSSTIESCARTCGCWCAGKTSTIRLMVETAEFVCSVAKVKCPVSAIRSADSIVSRSRISPISTTSGSSRSAARSEFANECVSECTSRWFTRHFLWLCRNSIGSSIVIMCSSRSLLILSSIAASVVDLPDPVGPVTSTRPRGLSHSALHHQRQAQRVETLDLPGNRSEHGGHGAALMEDVAAEAREALQTERKVELQIFFQPVLLHVRQHAVSECLRVRGGQRRHIERTQLAVHANARRACSSRGADRSHPSRSSSSEARSA